MSDNVIILGAGFSHSAGIPLMGQFVDTMWDFAVRGSARGVPLSQPDAEVFAQAEKVRKSLNGYHGRAKINDRNIEDILSILTFEELRNPPVLASASDLARMNRAIARTIELTCRLSPSAIDPSEEVKAKIGGGGYYAFWDALFKWMWEDASRELPTIITFNYDLVLERSLLEFMAAQCAPRLEPLPIGYVHVQYHTAVAPNEFYRFVALGLHPNGGAVRRFERVNTQGATGTSEIEILKLHGSLNFLSDQSSWCPNKHNITTAVEQPLILPPIFAKSYGDKLAPAWRVALERLGLAKHVIFVGYSLPATDIYMQYFLRAALGPNQDLNSIGVFDAVFREKVSEHANHLRERFRECFSESLRERIAFYQPEHLQNYGALGRFLF